MQQITREMGCSIEDLVRWFPLAMGDFYSQTSLKIDDTYLIQAIQPLIEVTGISRPTRQIALLQIPVLELNLSFVNSLSPTQCQQVIKRFDLYTRRGGG